ncbi:MAG: PQQ-dependent sugar dehydrogenase, partial [Ruegeria sp.]
MLKYLVILLSIGISGGAWSDSLQTWVGPVTLTKMVDGLDEPWGIGFLPSGDFLVTERDGRLLYVHDGKARKVSGVPKVRASGQGGLLDVMIPQDFGTSREIFLTYSKPQKGGAGTAVAVGRLGESGKRLSNVRTIFELAPGSSGGRHFG